MSISKRNKPRATSSRAKEFDLIFGYLDSPDVLCEFIKSRHKGSKRIFEGIIIEYGNVTRLRNKIEGGSPSRPFDIDPVYIGHIDSIPISRRRELENDFSLDVGALSAPDVRVDLLIVDSEMKPYFISFKDAESQAKLGQVSRKTCYGSNCLEGGIDPSILSAKVPPTFTSSDTFLTSRGFKSISRQNRQFAWFKRNCSEEWEEYATSRLNDAYSQVSALGLAFQSDPEVFYEFLEKTIAGNLARSEDFYVVIGDRAVHFQTAMKRLRNLGFEIQTELFQIQEKKSLVVNISVNGTQYCVTKIEPSFEGAGSKVLQTKGIVFHFQQHLRVGNQYKQFLFDIAK